MPEPISQSWLRLGALKSLWKAGFHFPPDSSISQKTQINPPGFRLQWRGKGHSNVGKVKWLFCSCMMLLGGQKCCIEAAGLSTQGFWAKEKFFTGDN